MDSSNEDDLKAWLEDLEPQGQPAFKEVEAAEKRFSPLTIGISVLVVLSLLVFGISSVMKEEDLEVSADETGTELLEEVEPDILSQTETVSSDSEAKDDEVTDLAQPTETQAKALCF